MGSHRVAIQHQAKSGLSTLPGMRRDLKHFRWPGSPQGPWVHAAGPCTPTDPGAPESSNPEMNCSLNVKFDPKTIKLICGTTRKMLPMENMRWFTRRRGSEKLKDKEYQCAFPDCSLHGWVTLLEVNINQRQLSEMLVTANTEAQLPKSSPVLSTMWFFWNAPGSKSQAGRWCPVFLVYSQEKIETECPHNLKDSGTHVGCTSETS